jgi:hypothetical protein
MCSTFAKTITEADIVLFAAVSGDNNAIQHQRGVRGKHHFQGPHRPWNAVGKRDLRSNRQQAARSRQHLRVAKPAIQGACPSRRYRPRDRHGQRDERAIPIRPLAALD